MQTATRVRFAAACCAALGVVGAGVVYAASGLARPSALAACALVVLVGVVLYRRADGAEARRPGW